MAPHGRESAVQDVKNMIGVPSDGRKLATDASFFSSGVCRSRGDIFVGSYALREVRDGPWPRWVVVLISQDNGMTRDTAIPKFSEKLND